MQKRDTCSDESVRGLLDRLKVALGIRFDKELAEIFGVTPTRLSNWIARDSISRGQFFRVMDDNQDICRCWVAAGPRLIEKDTQYICRNGKRTAVEVSNDEAKMVERYFALSQKQRNVVASAAEAIIEQFEKN